ncbi:hypothetical protein HDV01_007373 [Terramyces sp. JEL0728]|nr:hypothetical protein HDV01_007373 [Terramyces sp. JEL0728]
MFGADIAHCGVGCQSGFGLCQNDVITANQTNSPIPVESNVNTDPQSTGSDTSNIDNKPTRDAPGEPSLGTKFLVSALILGGLLAFIGVLSTVLYMSSKKKKDAVPYFDKEVETYPDNDKPKYSPPPPSSPRRPGQVSPASSPQSLSQVSPARTQAPSVAYTQNTITSSIPSPPKDDYYNQDYRPYSPSAPSTVVLSEDAQKILLKRALQQKNDDLDRQETANSTQANYAKSEHGNQ